MRDVDSKPDISVHDKTIARGAMVNVLGNIGKGLFLLFFVLISRMYGLATVGVFYIVYTMIEVTIALTVSGFNDGVLMFTSRYADNINDEDRRYRVLANGFVITLIVSAIVILFAHVGGPELLLTRYDQPGVLESAQLLVWSLPVFIQVQCRLPMSQRRRLTRHYGDHAVV